MLQVVSNEKSPATFSVLPEGQKGEDSVGRVFQELHLDELDDAGIGSYEKGALSTVIITSLLFFSALACLVAALFFPAVSIPLFLASLASAATALLLTPVNIALSAKA